jgi:hypothetical protein
MSTLIARMLQAIYPPSEMRVLIVALDATGVDFNESKYISSI